MRNCKGFTVLELLITIGIISAVVAVIGPNFGDWQRKQALENSYKELENHIHTLKSEALIRNTTSRMLLSQDGETYTITAFVAPTPTPSCDPTGAWVQLYTKELFVPTSYTLSGSGVGGNVCFYRDHSASGAQYDYTGGSVGTASIIVTMATGYLDVTIN